MAGILMEIAYEQRDVKLKVNVTGRAILAPGPRCESMMGTLRLSSSCAKTLWVEMCLQNEAPMFNLFSTSSAPTASALKRTEQYTNGTTGVGPCQGSYGSALSCLRSKFICSMEGLCQSKATSNVKDVKASQGAGRVNRTRPHDCAGGPLAMEQACALKPGG